MKSVTVIIPNWNGISFLEKCLTTLTKQDTDDYEILLVDNASEDESVSYVKTHFPQVEILENDTNLGFSGGVNVGIAHARTPYIILLNNDVEVEMHFVKGLLDAISQNDKIFSVSARMVNYRQRQLLDDCGDTYNVFGFQAQRGVGQSVEDPRYLKPAQVFSACGGAAIYRRRVFEEMGAFDESHFAYLEDIDVGYRALLYGYENHYTPGAVVYHIGSAASGAVKYSSFKVRLSARNSIYVVYKNMPGFFRVLNALPIFVGHCMKKKFFQKKGFLDDYLAGLKEGKETCKNLKKVPVSMKYWLRYIKIEGRMIGYTFSFLFEYLRRNQKRVS